MGMQQGTARENTIHTVFSADDPLKTLGLVLQVRMLDKWEPPGVDAEELRVMVEDDPEWLPPSRLAPFSDIAHKMWAYRRVAPDVAHKGVVVLSDCHRARPPYALTDARVPTLSLAYYLHDKGWIAHHGHVVHNVVPIGDQHGELFDSREATRMKPYYMCLHQLQTVLPLAGGAMPSQQPMLYYKLLMRGDRATADLGAKAYTLQWNRGHSAGGELAALPAPEPAVPLANGENFDVHPEGWVVPVPRGGGGRGPIRGGRGQGRGRAGEGGRGRGAARGRGGVGEPPPLPDPPPVPGPPPVAHEPEDFDAPLVPVAHGPPPQRRRRVDEDRGQWVDGLDGAKVMFDYYVNKQTGRAEPNWKLRCRFCEGFCVKRRGALPKFEARHGIVEPLAFLQCWHLMEWPSKPRVKSHALDEPTQEAVDAYLEEHAAELRGLLELCNR